MELLLILAGLFAFALLGLAAVAVSAKRQGRLAGWALGWVMSTRLGRAAAERSSQKLFGEDAAISPETLHSIIASQPHLIEQMAAEQGIDAEDAKQALARFAGLDAEQQQQLIAKAQDAAERGLSPDEAAQAIGGHDALTTDPATEADARAERSARGR